MLRSRDKKRIAQMWSKINRNMNTEDRAAFAIWKLHLWLLADFARDCARLCHKQYVTDAVSDVFEEVNEIPTLMSDPVRCCSNELKQVVQLEQENARLSAAAAGQAGRGGLGQGRSPEEVLEFLSGFEFWRIEKSSTGRITITAGPCGKFKTTGGNYMTLSSRKNETLCELCVRLKLRINEVVGNGNN